MGNPLYLANIQYAPLEEKQTSKTSQGPYQKYRRVLYLQRLHNLPLRGKQLCTFETFRLQNCDALKKHQTHNGGPAVPKMSHSCTIQCPANK